MSSGVDKRFPHLNDNHSLAERVVVTSGPYRRACGHYHPPFPGGPLQDLEVRLTTEAHVHHPHHVQPGVAPLQPQEEEGFCVKIVEVVLSLEV